MAEDIFGFDTKFGNGFVESGDGILIGESGNISLIQQWNVGYNIQAQPIFECGTSTVYYTAKHASGTLTCSRIVSDDFLSVTQSFGSVCLPKSIIVKAYSGKCDNAKKISLTLCSTMLSGIGISGQAQNAYVGEEVQANFVSLHVN